MKVGKVACECVNAVDRISNSQLTIIIIGSTFVVKFCKDVAFKKGFCVKPDLLILGVEGNSAVAVLHGVVSGKCVCYPLIKMAGDSGGECVLVVACSDERSCETPNCGYLPK